MEASILFAAVAALIVLAVTSMRYGVDSRDSFASKERELAARGIVWGGSLATRNARPELQGQGPDEDCLASPRGA